MSSYSTDASIVSQVATKGAIEIITSGYADLEMFEELQSRIFNQTIATAGAETLVEIMEGQTKRGSGGGGYARKSAGPTGYTPKSDVEPADVIVNFGKYRGQTVSSILDQDSEYVEWLAENANHADVKSAATAVLATV